MESTGEDDEEEEDADELEIEGSDEDGDDAEEEEDGDEEEDEDADDDDDDDADDIAVELSVPSKQAKAPSSSQPKKSEPAPSALSVAGGFDWSGRAASPTAESASDSESDEETVQASKPKSKKRAAEDLAASAPGDAPPSSSAEYERALFASPNSSFLWIQYMSFLLQLHEVDKARRIGRQALEKIAYREEGEKLNVWMALVNLELGFGTEDTAEKVFKEAVQYNDARSVYTRYAEALAAAGKDDATEEVHKKIVKKFSAYPDSWTKFAEFYLAKGEVDAARALLPRAMKSLDKSKRESSLQTVPCVADNKMLRLSSGWPFLSSSTASLSVAKRSLKVWSIGTQNDWTSGQYTSINLQRLEMRRVVAGCSSGHCSKSSRRRRPSKLGE